MGELQQIVKLKAIIIQKHAAFNFFISDLGPNYFHVFRLIQDTISSLEPL